MASSSKSPSTHHGEDLSEKLDPNEVRLSKGEQNPYSYPEHLKVEELVPIKLDYPYTYLVHVEYVEWNKKYVEWRPKMLDIITREGLLGFIDGTVQAPAKTETTSVNGPKGGNTTHEERENEEYVTWKRSDELVRKWIRNRLGRIMSSLFERYETAKELWEGIAGAERECLEDKKGERTAKEERKKTKTKSILSLQFASTIEDKRRLILSRVSEYD